MSGCREGQVDERIIAHGGDGFQGHVAGSLDGPLVVLLEQDGADEPGDSGFVGEDADDLGSAFDLAVEALQRVCNRYEDGGADVRLGPTRSWRMVRPSGTEAPGARRCGQADVFDELRARVSSWPPLRLARLRRERGSVGVVSPAAPVTLADGGGNATCCWNRHPPDLRRGGDLGRR